MCKGMIVIGKYENVPLTTKKRYVETLHRCVGHRFEMFKGDGTEPCNDVIQRMSEEQAKESGWVEWHGAYLCPECKEVK